jgi:hypothetical protein
MDFHEADHRGHDYDTVGSVVRDRQQQFWSQLRIWFDNDLHELRPGSCACELPQAEDSMTTVVYRSHDPFRL